jgi:hypothetical protein
MSAPLTSLDREGIAFDRARTEFVAAAEGHAARLAKARSEYIWNRTRQFYRDPKLAKQTILQTPSVDWNYCTEDIDELRIAAEEREAAGLTDLERDDLDAALTALAWIEQDRKEASDFENERPSYRPSLCG